MDPPDHRSPHWINYLYYGSLFALLVVTSASSILLRENISGSQFFFLFYSIGEAGLEVVLFILVGALVRRFLPNIFFSIFIALTFICFLIHLIDFLVDRVLNFTIWETIDAFVFDETFENFMNLLEAAGLPLWMWAAFFLLILLVPLLGVAIYRATDWLARKNPLGVRLDFALQACMAIPIALFLWDVSASNVIHREVRHSFMKSLPWKMTFLKQNLPLLSMVHPLEAPQNEEEVIGAIDSTSVNATHRRPNIYLFIVESLREDILRAPVAPNLEAFKASCLPVNLSVSNANASQISWFSIFHSNVPLYWNTLKKQGWTSGSPALRLLKKMGYQIRVYTAANLAYYELDELIFGRDLHLADSFQPFLHTTAKEAWKSDAETLEAFARDLSMNRDLVEGQCCIFFWDSTHFDYSWPKDEPPLFAPVASEINYFRAIQSKENIELIKNRYRNAVHYVDGLFGQFLSLVKDKGEAVIAFTGDHGEEFFEHGHLFHNSELTDVQTQVPIYIRPTSRSPAPLERPAVISHMDLFPTLLDAVEPGLNPAPILKGHSFFRPMATPCAVIARFNASRTPYEFCLHNGTHKFIARFQNRSNIFRSKFLQVISLRTARDEIVSEGKQGLDSWVRQEFGTALDKLFTVPLSAEH